MQLHVLILLAAIALFAQTRVDQRHQTQGTTIAPNGYYWTAQVLPDGPVQLIPGSFYGRYLKVESVTPPPNSQSRCGVALDGASHPAYELVRPNSVIETETHLYFCTTSLKWRRIPLQEF